MNIRFRHVCLRVNDLKRSIAFYCEHLGFREGPAFKDSKGNPTGMFIYLNSGVFLELFSGGAADFTGHLCFEVENLRETVVALRAKGLEVSDPSLGRSKAWIAGLKDPDGYTIELNEYSHEESWIADFLSKNDPAQMLH